VAEGSRRREDDQQRCVFLGGGRALEACQGRVTYAGGNDIQFVKVGVSAKNVPVCMVSEDRGYQHVATEGVE